MTAALSLNYAVTPGSATDGTDFVAVNGTLNFAGGEVEKSFAVTLKDDGVYEGDEVVNLRLSAADGTHWRGATTSG